MGTITNKKKLKATAELLAATLKQV